LRRIASYAAITVPLLILTAYLSYRMTTTTTAREIPLFSEVNVPNGAQTQLNLQDGTKVWLNAGSHIRYDSDFGRSNRNLSLSGEAYFEVAKNEHVPFTIDVEKLKIKVLGTHFNVNAYREDHDVAVSLFEGAVEMLTNQGVTTLKPGDMARYDADTGKTTVAANATANALAWRDNKLVFSGKTFEQIVHTLERNYKVKVNIQNEQIKERQFSGDFTKNETIEQIFTVMSANGKFRYRIRGDTVDVY
jgi:ferric-dicitrate binding protein FerR (iron transport regulator)